MYLKGESNPLFRCNHAKTMMQRLKGLLGADELSLDEGLLIEPCNSVHTFGMKHGLDIIYLDKTGTVLKCINNMLPRRVSAARHAKYTLELGVGAIVHNNIKAGDKLFWRSV